MMLYRGMGEADDDAGDSSSTITYGGSIEPDPSTLINLPSEDPYAAGGYLEFANPVLHPELVTNSLLSPSYAAEATAAAKSLAAAGVPASTVSATMAKLTAAKSGLSAADIIAALMQSGMTQVAATAAAQKAVAVPAATAAGKCSQSILSGVCDSYLLLGILGVGMVVVLTRR